jgi:Actin
MYCGDETGAFVGQVGCQVSKFGYGGDDAPKYVVPSFVLQSSSSEQHPQRRDTNKKSSSRVVLSSCYGGRHDFSDGSQRRVSTPLHRRNRTLLPSTTDVPAPDPVEYLCEGQDRLVDADAYEELWQSAMDVLQVRNLRKHTTGIMDNSTTIRSTGQQDGKCIHPFLSILPGYTFQMPLDDDRTTEASGGKQQESSHAVALQKQHNRILCEYTEILFEALDAPAVFLAPSAMCSSFCFGRPTSVLVELGAAGCVVTPVVDGIVLQQAQRRNGRGLHYLCDLTHYALSKTRRQWETNGMAASASPNPKPTEKEQLLWSLTPRYQLRRSDTNLCRSAALETERGPEGGNDAATIASNDPVYHMWAMQDLSLEFLSSEFVRTVPQWNDTSYDFASAMPFAGAHETGPHDNDSQGKDSAEDDAMDMGLEGNSGSAYALGSEAGSANTPNYYEFPDGATIDLNAGVGRECTRIPELLFTDRVPFLDYQGTPHDASPVSGISLLGSHRHALLQQHRTLSDLPLPQLIKSSLSAVTDVDIRRELCQNIVLTGDAIGDTGFRGVESRLSYELSQCMSPKCKVICSQFGVERSCSSWIGGSILSSLGSFQQLWLSRTEYDEYGVTLAVQRFP